MPIRGVLKMIAIPNMKKPKECWECPCINDSDCQALELLNGNSRSYEVPFHGIRFDCPLIDIAECWECINWRTEDRVCEYWTDLHEFDIRETDPNDSCSHGERRSDENSDMDNSNNRTD